VPKAYVSLAAGWEPNEATAAAIFQHSHDRLAPYKRIRRLEFGELPKTVSGKIRRIDLRALEERKHADPNATPPGEYREPVPVART
jgi:acetyl-CoA synthetase